MKSVALHRTRANAVPSSLSDATGVVFPADETGGRPTTAVMQAVLADSARPVDLALAQSIADESNWRQNYVRHLAQVTAAQAADTGDALAIADASLQSMRCRLEFVRDGTKTPLGDSTDGSLVRQPLGVEAFGGSGSADVVLAVPYRGEILTGTALGVQLDSWVDKGIVEPSFAVAIKRVIDHPEWLALQGRSVAVVGAGAELAPTTTLLGWGARVLAVDLPIPTMWDRLIRAAERSAGTLIVPVTGDVRGCSLAEQLPEVTEWVERNSAGPLALNMYGYADGGMHVRITAAFDALAEFMVSRRRDTSLAFLATPTDAFMVPSRVVEAARARNARDTRRVVVQVIRALSGGRMLTPPYIGQAADQAVVDVLVRQQGPNYAMAKRLQRWRGVTAASRGQQVSFNVAPATWTRSVTKNRSLAAAYAGAHLFGVEVFEPDTCRALMAAMLVHDLHQAADRTRAPEELFANGAAHGGLWHAAFEPRSALPLAAIAGTLRHRARSSTTP